MVIRYRTVRGILGELRKLGFHPKDNFEAVEMYNAIEKAMAQSEGKIPFLAKPDNVWYPKAYGCVEKRAVAIFTRVEMFFPAA